MPEVPYKPFSTVDPIAGTGTGGFNIRVPEAAFGGQVNQAIASVGRTMEGVGDEIFSRALALQRVRNESDAKEADAKYTLDVGDSYTKFEASGGKAASDGYAPFREAVDALRKKYRESLPNDEARRMFDSVSLGTMSRTIFSAGRHAAAEEKKYTVNASQARVDAISQNVHAVPMDDKAFAEALAKQEAEIESQAHVLGPNSQPPEVTAQLIGKARSNAWASRIDRLTKTDPPAAKQMLEQLPKGTLRSDDQAKVEDIVRRANRDTTARNVADAKQANWAPYMPQTSIDKARGVAPPLISIVQEAQRAHPELQFIITSGVRDQKTQDELVRRGYSRTRHSKHLIGYAVDLAPMAGTGTTHAQIEAAMKEASAKLNIPLSGEHDAIKSWDPYHYSLPRAYEAPAGWKAPEQTLPEKVESGKAWARKYDPNDPLLPDIVADRIRGEFNKAKQEQWDINYRNTNIINGAIHGNYGDKLPTTPEELVTLHPDVKAAWDTMDENHRKPFYGQLASNAEGPSNTWTEQGLRDYSKLKGLATPDASDEDRMKFLNTDVPTLKGMPSATKKELLNLQAAVVAGPRGHPAIGRAMQMLEPDLNAAQLTRKLDEEGFLQFRGSMSDQLLRYQREHKRMPTDEEIMTMGRQLMGQVATGILSGRYDPSGYWSKPLFRVAVPEEAYDAIKESLKGEGVQFPTDEQIRRIYIRGVYNRLYAPKEKR
jgi:uncharacterized protein YcbK (DUF882 family)